MEIIAYVSLVLVTIGFLVIVIATAENNYPAFMAWCGLLFITGIISYSLGGGGNVGKDSFKTGVAYHRLSSVEVNGQFVIVAKKGDGNIVAGLSKNLPPQTFTKGFDGTLVSAFE